MESGDDFVANGSESFRSQKSARAPRLFIKEMVMANFKSYAGEQRVGPFHKGD
ncbi:Structural maintenance of chromosomes protein 4 [Linum perenne]